MADAAERARWWHTASVMSAAVNLMRGRRSRPVTARELHPMESAVVDRRRTIDSMDAFCDEMKLPARGAPRKGVAR